MKIAVTALAFGLAGFAVAAGSAQAQQITGAGATFPAPVYTKWGEQAKAATGIELNYQAIGSGGGQNQILQRTVDFGASDAPMDAGQAGIRQTAAVSDGDGFGRGDRQRSRASRPTS